MAKQAKVLTQQELRRVLDYVATRKHADRNRAIILTMYYLGLRACELVSLRYKDVVDSDGKIRNEVYLTPEQTKGRYGRTLYVSDKLHKELKIYVAKVPCSNPDQKLFRNQISADGFTANSLAVFFTNLFKQVELRGASSHSFRRSLLTNLGSKGVTIRVLQEIAGHRSAQVTMRYIDVNDKMLKAAVELA
jgi:integrase/recombinase XerD